LVRSDAESVGGHDRAWYAPFFAAFTGPYESPRLTCMGDALVRDFACAGEQSKLGYPQGTDLRCAPRIARCPLSIREASIVLPLC
jgi:hypothetical protein